MQNLHFFPNFIFRSPLNATKKNIDEKAFSEALYLSTPTLYDEYQKFITNSLSDLKEIKKVGISLYKYQSRASNRCTPFGLFAGLGIGEWQNQNDIMLNANLKDVLKRKTRLDMNVLCSLAQELSKQLFIKPYLKLYPNTSIYLIGNSYRYVEYNYINNRRFHKINKVDFTPYLEHILNQSKIGLTQEQISLLLINDEISKQEVDDFINELIDVQLLITQLEPTVTGADYFDVLLKNLKEIYQESKNNDLFSLIKILDNVDTLIKANDANIFNSIESYKYIHQQLKTILPELSETNLFQTDLYKNTVNNTLNVEIQNQLKVTIQFLNKITPIHTNFKLEEFKKRFKEKYEDYEIPLLVALDTESGIGYPVKDSNGVNDLVDDIYITDNRNNIEIKWDLLQAHLLKLITDSNKQRKKIIEISENDFKNIDFSDATLPTTYSIMFNVLNSKTNKIDIGGIGGSSAITLLGRFAGGDDELRDIINKITQFEQKQMPNSILTEIVHLPESRAGNILARPSFRTYEIPYLAKSSVSAEFQIKMDDLVLKIKNNRIILFDKRLCKEIIPRLGNAHTFTSNSLPLYHFLCDLQLQYFSKPYLGFNWGSLANQFSFLPRVEYQNTVLSPAKWQLFKTDLEPFHDRKKSDAEKQDLFYVLKIRIELPDKFLIVDSDNELLIDCSSLVAIDTFIDIMKHRTEVTLIEYLFDDDNALIKDIDGYSYTNECIAIVLNETIVKEKVDPITFKTHLSKKLFSIGSEWLFYKIYCGAKTADVVLTEKIKQITETLLNEGIIDKWFFIRYADPDIHLRFRLHITNFKKYGDVLQLINRELEPLINQHLISKIQTDTYKRELDRYGDNSIELIEQLFYYDSVFVTEMLSVLDANIGGAIRWKIALRSVDEFLNNFKLTLEEKYNLIESLNISFFKEHGGSKNLKLTLDNKYRTLRPQIEEILNVKTDAEKEYFPIIELINNRSNENAKIIEQLLILHRNNQLQLGLYELLASLLHMNLDRLFMGRNRTNEFVIYDLLFRFYKSSIARLKGDEKKQSDFVISIK
ncbi:MAG: Lantibiotic dehydratase domain protein [Bacteroidetes bacterium]|jgi:thiopeptide-type bacteriocin biosynthesis protein|nr:Lantibiotic dehydratase domain protein [Bacteroidota bacterium]